MLPSLTNSSPEQDALTNQRPGQGHLQLLWWLHHALHRADIYLFCHLSLSLSSPPWPCTRDNTEEASCAGGIMMLLCYYLLSTYSTSPSHIIWLKQLPREHNFTVNIISKTHSLKLGWDCLLCSCFFCLAIFSVYIFCVYIFAQCAGPDIPPSKRAACHK